MRRFNWDIGHYCNFKCPYCFGSSAGWENLARLQGLPRSPEEIVAAWKTVYDSYGTCTVYITGGEPFLYPGFVEIIAGISVYHRLHVTSNLSQPLETFIKKADRHRVELNATYHPRYMEPGNFVRQVQLLRSAGFNCGTCYLAHPTQLREMLNYRRYMKEAGIDLGVTEFCGIYENREYPDGYTADERAYLAQVTRWQSLQDDYLPPPKTREQNRPENVCVSTNVICRSGFACADVGADGAVRPCRSSTLCLGNLFDGTVVLLEQPFACAVVHCRKAIEELGAVISLKNR